MSIPLPLIDLTGATVGQKLTLPLSSTGLTADPSITGKPAHVQLYNDSGVLFAVSFKTSGNGSYLSPGAWKPFTLAPAESEIDLLVLAASTTTATANKLSGVYYAPGEPLPDIGTLGNSVAMIGNSINIASVPAINIASGQFVNIANTPNVNIANSPNVNIANTPTVNVNSGTITANVASGTINVGNQQNPLAVAGYGTFQSKFISGSTATNYVEFLPVVGKTNYISGFAFSSAPLSIGSGNIAGNYEVYINGLISDNTDLWFLPPVTCSNGPAGVNSGGQGMGAQLVVQFGIPGIPAWGTNIAIYVGTFFIPTGSQQWYLSAWGYLI